MREKLKTKFKSEHGFTLVELMATIAILALIVVIAIPAIGSIMERAEDGSMLSSIEMVEKSAELASISQPTASESYAVRDLIDLGYLDLDETSDLVRSSAGTSTIVRASADNPHEFAIDQSTLHNDYKAAIARQ